MQILELFGGVGAPRIALQNLGYDPKVIDYVEIDLNAVRSYNAMFNHEHRPQSVQGWNLKPDVLVHGSPCQDFSIAGKREAADPLKETRSSLMFETLSIIENMGVWKPRIVLWENVKNVLSSYMKHNFQRYLDKMDDLGYANSFELLDATEFGLPQKRERVFCVSILGGPAFNFGLVERTPMKNIRGGGYLEADQNVLPEYAVTQPSMLTPILEGGKKGFGGPPHFIEEYALTITTKQMRWPNSGFVKCSGGFRYLTPRECWRLQGFRDEHFDAAASVNGKTALYKQAGNSMPIPVLEAIFKPLLEQ